MLKQNMNRGMSFEELRRLRSGQTKPDDKRGRRLFETDWEVFVARYNENTGKYDSRTLCCDGAVS